MTKKTVRCSACGGSGLGPGRGDQQSRCWYCGGAGVTYEDILAGSDEPQRESTDREYHDRIDQEHLYLMETKKYRDDPDYESTIIVAGEWDSNKDELEQNGWFKVAWDGHACYLIARKK